MLQISKWSSLNKMNVFSSTLSFEKCCDVIILVFLFSNYTFKSYKYSYRPVFLANCGNGLRAWDEDRRRCMHAFTRADSLGVHCTQGRYGASRRTYGVHVSITDVSSMKEFLYCQTRQNYITL
jgi:hypothetical protein